MGDKIKKVEDDIIIEMLKTGKLREETQAYKTFYSRHPNLKRKHKGAVRKEGELRPKEKRWFKDVFEHGMPKVGEIWDDRVITRFDPKTGYPVDSENRNMVLGTMVDGNSLAKDNNGGRPKGSRNRLTQFMLEVVESRQISPADFLTMVYNETDGAFTPDAKVKAAMKMADIVYPKAQSIELDIIEEEEVDPSVLDARIAELLGTNVIRSISDEESEEEEDDEE